MSNLRFRTAMIASRPRGKRVIEAFSPKLGRRLQCFGEEAYGQWICLEADPAVETFCERPVELELTDGSRRPADFWVRHDDVEMLLIIDGESNALTMPNGDTELAAARIWIGNWMRMLPCMISSRQVIPKSMVNSVLKFISEPMPLSRIEQEFSIGDPTLIRAVVFSLLHAGQLQSPQLHTETLSYLTRFQPARGHHDKTS